MNELELIGQQVAYEQSSVEEAADLTRFFFGDEMADDVLAKGDPIVPECTGIWWRT